MTKVKKPFLRHASLATRKSDAIATCLSFYEKRVSTDVDHVDDKKNPIGKSRQDIGYVYVFLAITSRVQDLKVNS